MSNFTNMMPTMTFDQAFFLPSDPFAKMNSPSNVNMVTDSSSSSSSSTQEAAIPSFVAERRLLGPDYVPGAWDVICARGSGAANHQGNLRFREIIAEFVPKYAKATTKIEKSIIVTEIVEMVRDKTPDGGFVKKMADGNWYEVGDAACREKIGQTLRDHLHHLYKSSTRAKRPRRKQLKEIRDRKEKARQAALLLKEQVAEKARQAARDSKESEAKTTKITLSSGPLKEQKPLPKPPTLVSSPPLKSPWKPSPSFNSIDTPMQAFQHQTSKSTRKIFKAKHLVADSKPSISALLKSFPMPKGAFAMRSGNSVVPAVDTLDVAIPALDCSLREKQYPVGKTEELSFADIFDQAFEIDGMDLNSDSGLRW